jgi:hypothetical protein
VYEKSLEMRHFLVFRYPEEARLAPSWAAGVAGEGLGGSNQAGWMYNGRRQKAKTEIRV